jgi:predicted Zn-dependent protease
VEWSVDRLRAIAKVKENDPGSETDLAEALSHLDGGKKEARTILERLAKTDLITSPEGYAALAQLRAESGDAAGEQVAMQRCERMARSASVCRAGVTG